MSGKRWYATFVASTMAVLSLPLSTSVADAAPTSRGPRVPSIAWADCGADLPGVECATVLVPLDYDRPTGATTQLFLTRVRASDAGHRIGSVFVNPGGPGASGAQMVAFGFGEYLDMQLDGKFDVIGMDPRGVASSDPLHCFATSVAATEHFAGQPFFPWKADQARPFWEAYRSYGDICRRSRDPILPHMNTADVARDMDLLRQAVGDSKLTYLGFSYGSFLGETYANLFPSKVRALVIDGVLDPRLWTEGKQINADRTATEKVFNEFLRLCDQAGPEACGLSTDGTDAEDRWERLLDYVRDNPIDLGDGFVLTYDFVVAIGASMMYSPEFWGGEFGDGNFLGFLADTADGDPIQIASAAEAGQAVRARLTREADYPNGQDAFFGNYCADAKFPSSFSEWVRIGKWAGEESVFGPYWWWTATGCTRWERNDDRYTGPWTARTAAPVLVVGNYFDGATDYNGAKSAAMLLRNSRLLSYAGWGHTAYGRSQCVTDYVNTYLLSGKLPPKGKVCPANPNPFLVTLAASAPGQRTAGATEPLVGLAPPLPIRG